MTANRRPLFVVVISSVVILVLYLTFRSSPGITSADPAVSQTMGGGMGNGGGMREMMRRMRGDIVPPGVNPQDLPAPNSEGARLIVRYCTQCHNLASPSMHTAKEWKSVAHRMFKRMLTASARGMMGMSVSMPSAEQQKEILAYLQTHALKPISPAALGSPKSPGAVAFRRSCSQCHALPNPELHNAHDWATVVRKMQSYAKQMSKKAITDQQANEIEGFLASHTSH